MTSLSRILNCRPLINRLILGSLRCRIHTSCGNNTTGEGTLISGTEPFRTDDALPHHMSAVIVPARYDSIVLGYWWGIILGWILYSIYNEGDHLMGSDYLMVDPKFFSDEQLGIPPDEEDHPELILAPKEREYKPWKFDYMKIPYFFTVKGIYDEKESPLRGPFERGYIFKPF